MTTMAVERDEATDLPRLEEKALVLANRLNEQLTRRSIVSISALISAISVIPFPDELDLATSRYRRARALRTVRLKYNRIQDALPIWKRLNEPNYHQIAALVYELGEIIDDIEA